MKRYILAGAVILAIMAMGEASSAPGVGVHFDLVVGKEHTLAFAGVGNPVRFDLELEEWADLNGDGDFADTNEQLARVTVPDGTSCNTVSTHFACALHDNNQHLTLVWKANSTFQQVDRNYTLTITWENALGTVQDRTIAGVRFYNDTAVAEGVKSRSTTQDEAVSTRTQVNATGQSVIEALSAQIVDQAKQIRNRTHILMVHDNENMNYVVHIPSAATKVTMRMYSLIGDGGPDDITETLEVTLNNADKCAAQGGPGSHFGCQIDKPEPGQFTLLWKNNSTLHNPGNYSFSFEFKNNMNDALEWRLLAVRITDLNTTAASSGSGSGDPIGHDAFTHDCHGTGSSLCVNGHELVATSDKDLMRIIAVVVLVMALTLASTRGGVGMPIIGVIGSVMLMTWLMLFIDTFATLELFTLAMALPLVPFMLGVLNIRAVSTKSKARASMAG